MADKNPFDPRLDGVPLLLTLDGKSLSRLAGEPQRELTFMLALTRTEFLDALLLDAPDGLADHLPRGYAAAPDVERDARAINQVGSSGGFFGGVRPWSSRERRADKMGLNGEQREWFLYYETVTWFHRNSKRHFYVTSDEQLLSELRNSARENWWGGRRIITVRAALHFVGWLMRSRNTIYLDVRPNYTRSSRNYDFYSFTGHYLAPSRVRLHRWLENQADRARRDDLESLEQSMAARVDDLLRARDGVGFQSLRRQTPATVDEMLYHLRAAVATAAGLFDSTAVFAQIALDIDPQAVGGRSRVSLRRKEFRQALRAAGAESLADLAGNCGPLWLLLGALRNPVIHREGLTGVGYREWPSGPSESRLSLRADQLQAVLEATRWRKCHARQWGVQERQLGEPLIELLAFTHRFTTTTIRIADRLVQALADEIGAPPLERVAPADAEQCWKYGLLGGVVDELVDASAPGWSVS